MITQLFIGEKTEIRIIQNIRKLFLTLMDQKPVHISDTSFYCSDNMNGKIFDKIFVVRQFSAIRNIFEYHTYPRRVRLLLGPSPPENAAYILSSV